MQALSHVCHFSVHPDVSREPRLVSPSAWRPTVGCQTHTCTCPDPSCWKLNAKEDAWAEPQEGPKASGIRVSYRDSRVLLVWLWMYVSFFCCDLRSRRCWKIDRLAKSPTFAHIKCESSKKNDWNVINVHIKLFWNISQKKQYRKCTFLIQKFVDYVINRWHYFHFMYFFFLRKSSKS